VHLDLPLELLPDDYVLLAIELDDVAIEELTRMPADSASFGDDWLTEQRSPVLQVPSVIVPESPNLLLNPGHPALAQARIIRQRRFAFDRRLWRPP
jgi:RES domain-containing protein